MRLAYPDLLAVLQAGSTVITPTPLPAAIANEQYNRAQLARGRAAWERPAVYSMDAWLTVCWQEARFSQDDVPTLLSPLQERELWRLTIEADRPDLFDPASMANLARRSAQTLAEYQIPLDEEDWTEREDARQFQSWLRQLRGTCRSNGWMLRSDLWRLYPQWRVASNKRVFTSRTPAAVVRKAEAMVFDSFAQEVEHAARVARELVEAGETSIAIFVPELSRNSSLLKRTFNAVFYPSGGQDVAAFHLNAHPLEKEPQIAGALLLLELAKPRIDQAVAGTILRSPFLAGAKEERSARALADVSLRRARELDVTLRDMEYACRDCPLMTPLFKDVRGVLKAMPARQSPSGWSRLFSHLLTACKWPSSNEWSNALSDLSTLALVRPEIDMNTAVSRLREILSRPVQVGDWSSPVQILDASSAAGVEFDHALILGLSEEAFLRPAALSPLLPFRLQRIHNVPEITEVRDASARALFSSATKIRATFSKDLPAFLKPFIKGAAKRAPAPRQALATAALEQIEDGMAPPLAASMSVRGGASVIKAQSQCPFRAFAEYRLNARPPEDACFGYDARDRGGFTHKALELVWKELGTQQNLKSLSSHELRDVVRRSVLAAVKSAPDDGPLHQLASLAEHERLEILILTWLDVEKERQKAFTVEHIEEKRYYEAPGLRLDLRVDRIDRLANGSAVLIDYKTGKQSKNKLEGPRPREPQLLVYAAALGEPVEGLLFGELTPAEPRMVGHAFGRHVGGQSVKDHKLKWDEFLDTARDAVATLAAEFVAGVAVVRPERGACSYCTAFPLCRINESKRADEDED